MITEQYLNSEIELATKIFLYYTEKMLDYSRIGNFRYNTWYVDSLQISVLLGVLENVVYISGTPYLGDEEISADNLLTVFYKIREYWLAEIDDDYVETALTDITIPTGSTYTPYVADWKEVIYEITEDGTTQFTLPFVYGNIDPESLTISVDDMSPLKQSSGAYYIENNILYWQYYTSLNNGDKIYINYKQIKG